jgi:hypothetical protein
MEIGVRIEGHIEVEDDVDLLNIDAAAEKFSGHQNAVTELLEALIDLQSNKTKGPPWLSITAQKTCERILTYLQGTSWSG